MTGSTSDRDEQQPVGREVTDSRPSGDETAASAGAAGVSSSSRAMLRRDDRPGRRFAALVLRLPFFRSVLDRMPVRCRPALYFETLSNIGTGAFLTMFGISLVVLETILEAQTWHLALLATMFFGSSLFSPVVTYVGRRIPMRLLVVVPNLLVAVLLLLTASPWGGALWFALVIGASFCLRVFPRVAEMNLFRVLYPPSSRGTAIGWTKAISALSGLAITLLSWWWFDVRPAQYAALFCLVAVFLAWAAFLYARIPVRRTSMFVRDEAISPQRAFRDGLREFLRDRRFLQYQFGFALAGIANHMSLWLVPDVLKGDVVASDRMIRFVVAVMPPLLIVGTSPLWGRFLDRRDPMFGRAVFNGLQVVAFAGYGLGGLTGQLWPFVVGAAFHAVSNGGGTINWLTGSLYFARPEHVSLYNGLHVCLTGVRGLIGPAIGLFLFVEREDLGGVTVEGFGLGSWVFVVSAVLSVMGMLFMLYLHYTDSGSREVDAAAALTA